MTEREEWRQVAGWLREARRGVAFTGAGISTESGIPDFRSPGGIWSRSQPVLYEDFLSSAEARHEYWRQKSHSHADFAAAEPNDGHRALARWEARGWLKGLITQNIDGLHQAAGSRNVLELHGTAREIACLSCRARFDPAPLVQQFLETEVVPECPECGGLLKHATISFGQSLPADVLQEAIGWSRQCDLFLAMGSSLVVEPAASLPRLAGSSGAHLVIINREPTDQDDRADVVLRAGIGRTLLGIDRMAASER
ncbi:MAG: SIR2 family NAD-dependent protein deacylase [Planctomycetota bacterium]